MATTLFDRVKGLSPNFANKLSGDQKTLLQQIEADDPAITDDGTTKTIDGTARYTGKVSARFPKNDYFSFQFENSRLRYIIKVPSAGGLNLVTLLLKVENLTLGLDKDKFLPAKINANGLAEVDNSKDMVRIVIPVLGIQFRLQNNNLDVDYVPWIENGQPAYSGEPLQVIPKTFLHASGAVAFMVDNMVLDLDPASNNGVPAEVIEKNLGKDYPFKGLYANELRVFINPIGTKGYAVNSWTKGLLLDFNTGFNGEFGAEVVNKGNDATVELEIAIYDSLQSRISGDKNNGQTEVKIPAGDFFALLNVRGGHGPYNVNLTKTGVSTPPDEPFRYTLHVTDGEEYTITASVTDKNGKQSQQELKIIGTKSIGKSRNKLIVTPAASGSKNYELVPAGLQLAEGMAVFQVFPKPAKVMHGTVELKPTLNVYSVPCTIGQTVEIKVEWTEEAVTDSGFTLQPIRPTIENRGPNLEYIYYNFDKPDRTLPNRGEALFDSDEYIAKAAQYYLEHSEQLAPGDASFSERLNAFLSRSAGRDIQIYSYASCETKGQAEENKNERYNDMLAERRARVLKKILQDRGTTSNIIYNHTVDPLSDVILESEHVKGEYVAKMDASSPAKDKFYHTAIFFYKQSAAPITKNFTLQMISIPMPEDIKVPASVPPPTPSLFRKIGVRVKFQKHQLIYAEIFGELDFKTAAEQESEKIFSTNPQNFANALSTMPGANKENVNGIVDYSLRITYDQVKKQSGQTISLGFERRNEREGFIKLRRWSNDFTPNAFASTLLFAPLLSTGIEAVQIDDNTKDRIKDFSLIGVSVAATAIGTKVIDMNEVTLFAGEASVNEFASDIALSNLDGISAIAMLFDYGVSFDINFQFGPLSVQTKKENGKGVNPPFVRYRGVGFKLDFENKKYGPVFDSSRGYKFDLGDPGALTVKIGGKDVSNLLKVLAARASKKNPFTLELDLGMTVNLGVISVEKFKAAMMIDDANNFSVSVLPSKIGVNVPGALKGSGELQLGVSSGVDNPKIHDGFRGALDLTIVPVKLRVAASVALGPVADAATNRSGVAFFLGIELELPAPIILGGTGLGIYGFLGLFAMHYKRIEYSSAKGLPPALEWFDKVKGNVIDLDGWAPEMDRWSFGVGLILGTMEGGFVLNLKGMFMLELPGPRFLIFVKAQLLFPKPEDVKNKDNAETAGLLAVIDLDFNLGIFNIGLILNYEVKSLLSVTVPVEASFPFKQPKKWHVNLGSDLHPAEAKILGIYKGYSFLMVSGDGIPSFGLSGFSIGVGIGASIFLGSKSARVYLEASGDLRAGVSFSPLKIVGEMKFEGSLHILIISISAEAKLTVNVMALPSPTGQVYHTFVKGEACGSVRILWKKIRKCVSITIGDPLAGVPPAELVKGVTLVNRTPAYLEGQAIAGPLDGSLGDAILPSSADPMPIVPIDAIIAVTLSSAPLVGTTTFFTTPIGICPSVTTNGFVLNSDGKSKVKYTLTTVTLEAAGRPDALIIDPAAAEIPVSWWQLVNDKNNLQSSVILALMTWCPDPTPHAMLESDELAQNVENIWGNVCEKVAKPMEILYTFQEQKLGTNDWGWYLVPHVLPPNGFSSTLPKGRMHVFERNSIDQLFDEEWRALYTHRKLHHAKVIGLNFINFAAVSIPSCRMLAAPYCTELHLTDQNTPLDYTLSEYYKKEVPEKVYFKTDAMRHLRLIIAAGVGLSRYRELIVCYYDAQINIIEKKTLSDFKKLNDTNLPEKWKGYLFTCVDEKSDIGLRDYLVVDIEMPNETTEIVSLHCPMQSLPSSPAFYVVAAEVLQMSEVWRHKTDQHVQAAKQDLLMQGLKGNRSRPLLHPNANYSLTMKYHWEKDNGENGDSQQTYQFRTNAAAPTRLNPYVFATTPIQDMIGHFVEDPIEVYFNDDTVFGLFRGYGKELKAVIRKANGNHPTPDPAKMILANNLVPVKAIMKSSWVHAVDTMLSAKPDKFPCISQPAPAPHQVFSPNVDLLRNTAYTFEIITEPATVNNGDVEVPLFKLNFTTSRYMNLEEMAMAVRNTFIGTKYAPAVMPALPGTFSDDLLDAGFLTAGIGIVKIPANPEVTLLWANDGSVVRPYCLLIDTPEPVWREREYSVYENDASVPGGLKIWTKKLANEMYLTEKSSGIVKSACYNISGCRTLLYLNADCQGKSIIMNVHKVKFGTTNDSTLNTLPVETQELINFKLPVLPPWMDE